MPQGPYVVKSRIGCACSPKTVGEERVFSSMVQEDGLLGAYFGWRKCAKVGNPWLGLLQDSPGAAMDGVVVGVWTGYGALEAGDSQKAVGKAIYTFSRRL